MGATSELLNNVFTCVTNERFTRGRPLFINIDQSFIESSSFFPSPPDNIVLEILETIPATPEIIQKIKEFQKLGFRFALDDFEFEPERMAFLPYVSIVKVDIMAFPLETLKEKLSQLKKYPVTLLAEKVETIEVFSLCQTLGFSLFQGYYLEKPKLVHGVKIPASKHVTLKLLAELSRDDINVNDVSRLITCDPRLAMKIILLVNSSLFAFVRKVNDIKEAVVILGIEAVKRWATILLLVSDPNTPIEIFRTFLARAKTLEIYATYSSMGEQDDYFLLGLFSGLDVILGVKFDSIISNLTLNNSIEQALRGKENKMNSILELVKLIEKYDGSRSISVRKEFTLLRKSYWEGLAWADETMESIVTR